MTTRDMFRSPFGPRIHRHPRGHRGAGFPCGPEEAAMHDTPDVHGDDRDDPRDEGGPGHRHGRAHRRGRGPGGRAFGPGRGFGPGGPFGHGGFGPGGFGPGGPRGRRGKRARGDVRTAVLAVVADGPRHGYEIIQEITGRSGGQWKPSPGSVYPMLSQLEDEGLVRSEQTEGRRVVHLTEEGTRHVEEHRAELDAVWAPFAEDAEAGSEAQVASATEALTEARKALYRLLAE
jgi:DNA-binding PadR family transcriptional regulator